MRALSFASALATGLLIFNFGAAQAQDAFNRYELRGGVFAHDPVSPEKGSADINAEMLSPRLPINAGTWQVLVPRLHLAQHGGSLPPTPLPRSTKAVAC